MASTTSVIKENIQKMIAIMDKINWKGTTIRKEFMKELYLIQTHSREN